MPTGDPVHDYDHVMRVYRMAERIAQAEGADMEIVRAAALLHDAVGSAPGPIPLNNAIIITEAQPNLPLQYSSRKAGLMKGFRLCNIAYWPIVFVSRRTNQKHWKLKSFMMPINWMFWVHWASRGRSLTQLWPANPSTHHHRQQFLTTGVEEPGEPHSSYHEYLFKLVKIKDTLHTDTARKIAASRHDFLVAFYSELAAEAAGIK